ncbi:hypothetical protein [Thermogemmatispora tikiterensis]|uniref:Uncharacterized protein n=1 Tax=Thermogemmatispora tikiterensis TaxID=1825093 RepID=A0A328V9H5_9CHLR|nr:hypothetical protein [Thermogemmatispora tikiterensis]RAQ94287.1 hypothetical protein A4R35_02005 [Thermogemmatispora tikiterensis]
MQESIQSSWQNFYVILGSASATLIGLMFIVITLLASRRAHQASEEAIGAFGTPTVVHMCAAFLVSLILSVPWPALWQAALLIDIGGLAGLIYILIVIRRARRQRSYRPVLEDWIWHVILPFLAYASFLGAGLALLSRAWPALLVIGAAAVLMLLVGIHNAWDTITYLTFQDTHLENSQQKEEDQQEV